jgi:hypothetical protein
MNDEPTIKITPGSDDGQTPMASCAECSNTTRHEVLASVELLGSYPAIDWKEIFQIVQCRGCETLSFRKVSTNSEAWDGYYEPDGSPVQVYREEIETYPSREIAREPVEDFNTLPPKVRLIYVETLNALSSNQPVLAGIGIRAIVETICKDANSPGSNLSSRIDGLVGLGKLSSDGAATLHKLRVLGNAAAHDVVPHDEDQLALGLDVVEHVLEALYILPKKMGDAFGT